jgi:hypothetical protein
VAASALLRRRDRLQHQSSRIHCVSAQSVRVGCPRPVPQTVPVPSAKHAYSIALQAHHNQLRSRGSRRSYLPSQIRSAAAAPPAQGTPCTRELGLVPAWPHVGWLAQCRPWACRSLTLHRRDANLTAWHAASSSEAYFAPASWPPAGAPPRAMRQQLGLALREAAASGVINLGERLLMCNCMELGLERGDTGRKRGGYVDRQRVGTLMQGACRHCHS